MRILPSWLRTMVRGSLPADEQQLADELTLIGIAVEGVDRSGPEPVFETEITTNRVDAMNHHGIARECSALYDLDLNPLTPEIRDGQDDFPISIAEPALCARFSALILRNVTVNPSVGEVAERFAALVQKLINNAADATNYVMLEMGKPTHVYDLDKLAGGQLTVRKARSGERLLTLDGVMRTLDPEDLVIADGEKPVGLGGVIGGEDTKVTETTRNILIESAWFDPAAVRAMAKRHGIHTDASHRFERGADYDSTILACRRVAELILAQGGGEVASRQIDTIARPMMLPTIELRMPQVRRILGKTISSAEVCRILSRLGFRLRGLGEERYETQVPTWRLDVSREIDLIEEIARLHGYNRFENRLPAFLGSVREVPAAVRETQLRAKLLALGYDEALSSSFVSHEDSERFAPQAKPVLLENPMNEERALMRTSLVPGMLDMIEHNLNRNQDQVHLFEIGNTFEAEGEAVRQRRMLCFASTRPNTSTEWPGGDFYQIKGDVEALLAASSAHTLSSAREAFLHPGRSAAFNTNGHSSAQFGEVAASAYGRRKIKQSVYLAEVDVDLVLKAEKPKLQYRPLSRYPAVERDFSFNFPEGLTWARIHEAVKQQNVPYLEDIRIVEVFRGSKTLRPGSYSALLRVVLQSPERTLTEDDASSAAEQIIAAVTSIGGELRSS